MEDKKCQYCLGGEHPVTACPKVKRVEFNLDGSVKMVEKYDNPTGASYSFVPTSVSSNLPTKISYSGWIQNKETKELPHDEQ
jgi:hypothetical protein